MKMCPKCGKKYEDIVNFCKFCGESVVKTEEEKVNKVLEFEKKVKILEKEIKELTEEEEEVKSKLNSLTLLKRDVKNIEEGIENEKRLIKGLNSKITKNVLNKIRRGLFMKEGEKQPKTILSLREGIKRLVNEMEERNLEKVKKMLTFAIESKIRKQNEELKKLRGELERVVNMMEKNMKQDVKPLPKGLDVKLKEMEKKIDDIKSFETAFEQQLKSLNINTLSDEIEKLRERVSRIESTNFKSLQTKIEELERKIESIKMTSPVIIE